MIFLKSLWNVVHLYEFFYAVYRLSEAHQFFEILEENHFWRCSIFAILKTLIDLIQTLFKTSILSSYLVLKPSPLVRIKLSIAPNENVRCGLKKTIGSHLNEWIVTRKCVSLNCMLLLRVWILTRKKSMINFTSSSNSQPPDLCPPP